MPSVLVGVRDFSDGTALDQISENVVAMPIDVTDEVQIAAAVTELTERVGRALDGVVANAGIGVGGALEEIEPARLREVFDVNVVGAVAITQKVLPLLRRAGGTVVLVGSIGGRHPVGRRAGAITRLRPLVPDFPVAALARLPACHREGGSAGRGPSDGRESSQGRHEPRRAARNSTSPHEVRTH